MRFLFTLLFSVSFFPAIAQIDWDEYFESPYDNHRNIFVIDTQTYHNNIWQIGKPHKSGFDSAYSYPNAIVTDSIHPYPVNDTSVFIVKYQKWKLPPYTVLRLHFRYKLDIDSGEIAKVEVSGDSGLHWVNVIKDDTAYDFTWQFGKPRLDTSTGGWKSFDLVMDKWPTKYPGSGKTFPSYCGADTFIYRFTFISDGNQTNKNGWMMDNFWFEDWTEGIEKIKNNNLISIYPNPSNGNIYLKQNSSNYTKSEISITNLQGVEVYKTDKLPSNGYLHLSLPDGVYMLKYLLGDEYAIKRIVIRN